MEVITVLMFIGLLQTLMGGILNQGYQFAYIERHLGDYQNTFLHVSVRELSEIMDPFEC